MTISDAFTAYVRYQREERGYSGYTLSRTRTFCRQLVEAIGDLHVIELTESILKQFQRGLYLSCKSPVTYYNRVVDIRRFVKFLYLRKLTDVSHESFPTTKKTEVEKGWLTPDQIRQLVTAIPTDTLQGLRDSALISLLASSGMRVGEVVNLRICDIGLEGSISVVGKGNKRRCVFVPESTLTRVYGYLNAKQSHANSHSSDELVFGMNRRSMHTITTKWGLIALGKPVNPHMLRHSFATNMAVSDMEVTTIARLMGHSDISTTTRYLHYADGRLHSLYERHSGGWGY